MIQSEIVHMENLCFRFPGSDVDVMNIEQFSVVKGERIFIMGPSGCGKSTMLSLVGGVNVPSAGQLVVLDTQLSELTGSERDHFRANHIGFIFQMFNLIPYLSMLDNVTLPCRFSNIRKTNSLKRSNSLEQEAIRLLKHLGLDDHSLYKRNVTELSMGQQQRVAAARALIGSPEIVIADEPTSALDVDSRASFLQLLFTESEAVGSTLIFVSHDPQLQNVFDKTVAFADINQTSHTETS